MLGEIPIGGAILKTISIFLALINSLLAGLLIAFNISSGELIQSATWWSIIKVTTSMMVILLGVVTWLASARGSTLGLVFMGGVFLLLLGAVTIVWTYHLAIVSSDMEYYMVGYGGSLMAQGMASLLGFAGESRNTAIS